MKYSLFIVVAGLAFLQFCNAKCGKVSSESQPSESTQESDQSTEESDSESDYESESESESESGSACEPNSLPKCDEPLEPTTSKPKCLEDLLDSGEFRCRIRKMAEKMKQARENKEAKKHKKKHKESSGCGCHVPKKRHRTTTTPKPTKCPCCRKRPSHSPESSESNESLST